MDKTVEFMKVLSDKTRLKIISLLSKQEMAVCELIEALRLSQPAVSHHLKLLKQSGLIQDNREGKWILYTINRANFDSCTKELAAVFLEVQQNLDQGIAPSQIRTEPCLCEELKTKADNSNPDTSC